MPTSSLFEPIVISDPEAAAKLIEALENPPQEDAPPKVDIVLLNAEQLLERKRKREGHGASL